MTDAFSQPGWRVSLLLQLAGQTEIESTKTERVPIHPNVQPGPANRQTFFSGRGDARESNLPFSGHIVNTFRNPTILQLNTEGLTASKMNVLHHLAVEHKAFVFVVPETHCTAAEKLILPSFALTGFSLSRKHGLATFIHGRLKYTF